MCTMVDKEKTAKLCRIFSLLDEKDQEYIFGVLEALLFAKQKMVADVSAVESEQLEAV